MEQFLGALSFAKDLGRTLVLPHLVEYPERMPTSVKFTFLWIFYQLLLKILKSVSNSISNIFQSRTIKRIYESNFNGWFHEAYCSWDLA